MAASRWGSSSINEINESTQKSVPANTRKSNEYVWNQFEQFCKEKQYELTPTTNPSELGTIMQSWAYNMKKQNGDDYKETAIKTLWNVAAKQLQRVSSTGLRTPRQNY